MTTPTPLLITGGTAHDFAYASARLTALLAATGAPPPTAAGDYQAVHALTPATPLITYTCRVSASAAERDALDRWLRGGGRWLALHGTNAVDAGSPPADLLGSRFLSHPPYGRFRVVVAAPADPLVAGVADFAVEDECYSLALPEPVAPLLLGQHGDAPPRPLLYRRPVGAGAVVYLALGHCDAVHGSAPRRGPWETAPFVTIVERALRWACGLA